eukprot:SAG11_NODE_2219_length_3674_cov_3.448951_1_plen_118_part_00
MWALPLLLVYLVGIQNPVRAGSDAPPPAASEAASGGGFASTWAAAKENEIASGLERWLRDQYGGNWEAGFAAMDQDVRTRSCRSGHMTLHLLCSAHRSFFELLADACRTVHRRVREG